MKKWLQRHQWTIVGALAVVAFLLGVFGLRQQVNGVPWPDAIFFALRLFGFEYDLQGKPYEIGRTNLMLQVARFLAPATVAFAVVKGLMLAVARWFNLWRISRWQGHAVVCGAGERGRQLALALVKEGRKVVVIEKNENADTLADLRAAGVRVVVGSSTDAARQAEARLDHASIVASVTPCEESNLQTVLAASRRTTRRPFRALAHATRPFAEMFETQPPFDRIVADKECSFFDHDVAAARLLVAQYGPELVSQLLHERRSARLLLAGDATILPELLGVVVTQCQYAGHDVPAIDVVIVDRDTFGRTFSLDHPQLPLVADVRSHERTLPNLLRLDLAAVRSDVRERPYDLAFAACREDIDTLTLARNLAQQAGAVSRDVVAGLRPSTQLMRLFVGDQPLAGVQSHDLVALGCSGDIVLHGRLDRIARRIHEAYLAEQLRAGRTPGATPALVPWEELPEGLRQANRAQADHMPVKRRTLELSRTEETIELLASAEHRRWMAEKIVAGWRHAAERDDARRLHPSIRPYDTLSAEEKQKDRSAVLAVLGGLPESGGAS